MKLKMKIGLAGPGVSLAPGDEHETSAEEGERLIKAGYADEIKDETTAQKVARLKAELAAAEAAAKKA